MSQPTIGDRATGRCATTGEWFTGTIVAIYRPRPGCGYSEPRYRLARTGQYYSCGTSVEPVVELPLRARI